jgi:hypothetical protein
MTDLEIASLVFACVSGSAMLGLFLGYALPAHHLSQDSKEVVNLGTALIATLAALVLGLLISSAKSSFDREDDELVLNAARVLALDQALADYGPETKEIRDQVKRTYAARIDLLFPRDELQTSNEDTRESVLPTQGIRTELWQLSPQSDAQRGLRSQALEITGEMSATRWLLLLQKDQGLPMPLLVVLVAWLCIIFATFALFAPRNTVVVASLFVCALSVSGAIFLILEMNSPFTGLMQISSAPMRDAIAQLGQ